jgi:hypothetical protein
VWRPFQAVGPREAEVGAERRAHRFDEALDATGVEAILPPEPEHAHAGVIAVDPRLDPADEAVTEQDGQH